jgi:hypothetical protein
MRSETVGSLRSGPTNVPPFWVYGAGTTPFVEHYIRLYTNTRFPSHAILAWRSSWRMVVYIEIDTVGGGGGGGKQTHIKI